MLNELIDLANDEEVPVIGSDWPKLEAQTHNCMGVMSVFTVQNWSVFTTFIHLLYKIQMTKRSCK